MYDNIQYGSILFGSMVSIIDIIVIPKYMVKYWQCAIGITIHFMVIYHLPNPYVL